MAEFVYPEEGYHTAVLGTTGSGKSTLAAFLISRAPFHLRPQYVIDIKYEKIFAGVTRAREVGVTERITHHPGLYIVRPRPDQQDEIEEWFERLWHHGDAGLYIDEAYLVPDKRWLRNLLAQGRSRGITVIAASQRPVDVPRAVFTEASYLSVFRLNDDDDKKRVRNFTPKGMMFDEAGNERRLPDFHSYWYSPKHHKAADPHPYVIVSPVPGEDQIIEAIDTRLRPKTKLI